MASEDVVRSVAKKLKYYFEVKSLEDGFNVSDIQDPFLRYTARNTTGGYGSQHARRSNEKQKLLANTINSYLLQADSLRERKEREMRKKLVSYMNHYHFQEDSHIIKANPHDAGAICARKKHTKLPPALEMAPNKRVSRGEAERLVNLTTQIMCNSSELSRSTKINVKRIQSIQGQSGTHKLKAHGESQGRKQTSASAGPRTSASAGPRTSASARPRTSASTRSRSHSLGQSPRLSPGHSRKHQAPNSSCRLSLSSNSSSTSYSSSSSFSSSSSNSSSHSPSSSKLNSPKAKHLSKKRQQRKIVDKRGRERQTKSDESDSQDKRGWSDSQDKQGWSDRQDKQGGCESQDKHGRKEAGRHPDKDTTNLKFQQSGLDSDDEKKDSHHATLSDQLEVEVHEGQDLKVHVQAKENFQASKIGPITIVLHGEDGRTKELSLNKIFEGRKGETFVVPGHVIGRLKKVQFEVTRAESRNKDQITSNSNNNNSKQHRYLADTKGSGGNPSSDRDKEVVASSKNGEVPADPDEGEHKATKIILHSMPSSKVVDEIILATDAGMDNQTVADNEHKKWLEKGKEATKEKYKNEKIHEAIKKGDTQQAKYLLYRFPHMFHLRDEKGWLPLHLMAGQGNTELLNWLVIDDVDVEVLTGGGTGYTAMHVAAMSGHVHVMIVLQGMGASIFSLTKEKQSALHLAAKGGHLECVKWLVANRASLLEKDSSGRTALALAEKHCHGNCAGFLSSCMQELSNPKSSFAKMYEKRDV